MIALGSSSGDALEAGEGGALVALLGELQAVLEVVALAGGRVEGPAKGTARASRSAAAASIFGMSASDSRPGDPVAVDLGDLSLAVSRSERGKPQVLAPVEEVAAQDGVRPGHLVARPAIDRQARPRGRGAHLGLVLGRVDRHRQHRDAGGRERRALSGQLRRGPARDGGADVAQKRRSAGLAAPAPTSERSCPARSRSGEIGRREGPIEPGRRRRAVARPRRAAARDRGALGGQRCALAERLAAQRVAPFLDEDPVVERHVRRASGRAPLGQRISIFRMRRLLPRPKSSSFECWEMKPEPACTTFVRRRLVGLDA